MNRRRTSNWVALALLAGLGLTGCGGSEESPAGNAGAAPGTATPAAAAPPSGDASAAEVAAEQRGKVRCPAQIRSPARANGAPVDDVVGVRPGLTYEEAANIVLCSHDLMVVNAAPAGRGFQVQTFGQPLRQGFVASFAQPRVQRTSREIMRDMQDAHMARSTNRAVRRGEPGQARWYVGTMGMPGQERVISAAREEWFETGRNPTVASVQAALIGKYGTPSQQYNQDTRRPTMVWAYDPRGRLIGETSPLYRQCHGNSSPDGGGSFSPDCGTVVQALVVTLQENPDLAESLEVGVLDQSGGYQLLQATEQGLQEMEAARRAAQVEEAARNAGGPTL